MRCKLPVVPLLKPVFSSRMWYTAFSRTVRSCVLSKLGGSFTVGFAVPSRDVGGFVMSIPAASNAKSLSK